MSQKLESNLILNIKASRFLTGVLLFVHLGGMILLLAVPGAWPVRLALGALLGWSLYRSLRIHAWRRGPSAIEAIEMDGEGMVSVRFAGRDDWHACQISSRFVHPWLTLLALKIENRCWPVSLAIAADAVEPEPFRCWRVALRFRTVAA
ncbi:MAG: hypothetical protein Q7J84_14060 [Sulfuricaulis sp.]|nr:hypothetical protein [Sulfuricaulis sp.]